MLYRRVVRKIIGMLFYNIISFHVLVLDLKFKKCHEICSSNIQYVLFLQPLKFIHKIHINALIHHNRRIVNKGARVFFLNNMRNVLKIWPVICKINIYKKYFITLRLYYFKYII